MSSETIHFYANQQLGWEVTSPGASRQRNPFGWALRQGLIEKCGNVVTFVQNLLKRYTLGAHIEGYWRMWDLRQKDIIKHQEIYDVWGFGENSQEESWRFPAEMILQIPFWRFGQGEKSLPQELIEESLWMSSEELFDKALLLTICVRNHLRRSS